MKIAIVGTGGVGGYFGGMLAKAGNDVTFIARGNHLEAMKANGLIVKSINGDFVIDSVSATDDISTITSVDVVLIGVKAWQVKEVAPKLKPVLKDDTVVLPLQNGVLAAKELSNELGEKYVLNGLCRIISKIESPGVIKHMGVDPTIVFGELNSEKSERVINLQKLFESAGIKAKVSRDIQIDLWKKFIAICVSGYLALTKTTYGEVLKHAETRQIMHDLMEEIVILARKLNVNIENGFLDKTMAFMDTFPYNSTSSLTRDVWEGRPSEIDYQNGAVVRLAEKVEVDVHINRFIYYSLLPMERKARNI